MYQQHIVHRDIKPDNIMFRETRKNAVLIDFGLVRDLDASSLTQTFSLRGPGTPLYSAPEQLNNNKALIDWRTDQFSLGLTLCIALFCTHPFEAGTLVQTVENMAQMNHCNETTKESILNSGFYPLIRMIEPYPIRRYRTPTDLHNDWEVAHSGRLSSDRA